MKGRAAGDFVLLWGAGRLLCAAKRAKRAKRILGDDACKRLLRLALGLPESRGGRAYPAAGCPLKLRRPTKPGRSKSAALALLRQGFRRPRGGRQGFVRRAIAQLFRAVRAANAAGSLSPLLPAAQRGLRREGADETGRAIALPSRLPRRLARAISDASGAPPHQAVEEVKRVAGNVKMSAWMRGPYRAAVSTGKMERTASALCAAQKEP